MRIRHVLLPAALLAAVALAAPCVAGILDKVKQKTQERVDRKTDQAIDKSLDKAEDVVKLKPGDKDGIEKANKEGKKVVLVDDQGNPLPADQQPGGAADASGTTGPGGGAGVDARPLTGVWANFDFVPGNRVLFYDDFSDDNVGDFPRKWEFASGSVDVVESQGARLMRSAGSGRGQFAIVLPEVLPQRFTLELDYVITEEEGAGYFEVAFVDPWTNEGYLRVYPSEAELIGKVSAQSPPGSYRKNRANKLMVLGDGDYLKVYINDKRVFNVPNSGIGPRGRKIWFWTQDMTDQHPIYIGNVRVAASDRKLYDALLAKGRVAMQGIYFDTGSDRLRPESSGTLREIGQMLKAHVDLKLRIEGHTDNVGGATANLALSDKRAAAVRQALIGGFAIEEARLQSQGFGATRPAASNDSPEGRQTNRRVELVKL